MITRRQAKLMKLLTTTQELSAPSPATPPPALTLVFLPDDALLAVLSHLPPRQLLVCRAVCRRLRAVCLHRDLWRAVHVDVQVDAGLLRAALHLAPCLRKITGWYGSLAGLAAVVAETACVVTEVKLWVLRSSEHEAALATDIILKLSALGGVRKLQLSVSCTIDTACMRLVKSIYRLHGLADLEVMNGTAKPLPGGWCRTRNKTPSLTRLHYDSSHYTALDPFAELLLRTHAATLEEVDLYWTEAIPTLLLAALPRLRSLTCCPSNDLSRLVELPNLSMLSLRHDHTSDNFTGLPVGTLNFLRQARHLQRVHLELPWNASATVPLVALRASRSAPTLESFEVFGAFDIPTAWELVATVPPRFPSLKTLAMCSEPSDEFLRAVSPASLPGLNELLVNYPDDTCFHAWVHDPAVQDVLVRNPRLHLRVPYGSVPESCSCRWCRWGCHKLIRGDKCDEFSFSAHSKGGDCPVNCCQVVGSSEQGPVNH